MNVEAQAIDVPTGAQDYRPALLRRHLGGRARRQRRPPRRARRQAGGAAAADRARLHQRVAQLGDQQLGRHQAAHRRRRRRAAQFRARSATSPPRCARRSSAATGRKSAARSPRSGTTARSSRPASPRRRSTRCSARPASAGVDRRQGLRRGRRRLPLLLRRARRDPRGPRRRSPTPAPASSTSPSSRAACDRAALLSRGPSRMDNLAIARVLAEIGDLLEIKGENPFKIRAYRNAADTIVARDRGRSASLTRGRAARAPGHRQGSRRQDRRAGRDRHDPYHQELLQEFPPTMLDLLHLQGVGPKTVARLYARARRPHARGAGAGGARRAHPRDEGDGREEGSAHPQGARGTAPVRRAPPDGRGLRHGRGPGRRAARARARGRHLDGRQPPPRLRDLRRSRHSCGGRVRPR